MYINYWVILLLFAVLLGWFLQKDGYPGNWLKFLGNFSGLEASYNGAWWYFTTYVFFILTSQFWFQLLDKLNPYLYLVGLLGLYVIAFYFKSYKTNIFHQPLLNYFHRQAALYFFTLFQFMLGAFALKYNWNTKVSYLFQKTSFKNILILLLMSCLVVFHAFFQNFILAPFTSLGFILLFTSLVIPTFLNYSFTFLAPHSTNMWLIHMFFYLIYFPDFVYSFNYPVLIFIVLAAMCVISSFVVNFVVGKVVVSRKAR